MDRLTRFVNPGHKVIAGPKTLLFFGIVFGVLFALVHGSTDPGLQPVTEQWIRSAVAASLIMGVLVWAERERPHLADL